MMSGGPFSRRAVSPLQFLMLIQLEVGPKYGYELFKTLRDDFEGVWELKTGTFYPALRRLEERGFVETQLQEEKEFYNLTSEGETLIDQFGMHMVLEHKFVDRYFTTLIKYMPETLKDRLFDIIQRMSSQGLNIYGNLPSFLDKMDKEKKLEFLNNIRGMLRANLVTVDGFYQSIVDGDDA